MAGLVEDFTGLRDIAKFAAREAELRQSKVVKDGLKKGRAEEQREEQLLGEIGTLEAGVGDPARRVDSLSQLRERLADLSLINFDKIPRDRISLGSRVVLLDVDKNEEITYRLVTTEDANVTEGLISTTSPIGRSLLNKREGDTVEVKIPSGTRTFEILSFTTMYDTQ